MIDIIIGTVMTFILYGMCLSIREINEKRRLRKRLRRMRDRYYALYEGARTEYDREYFYSVYEMCAKRLREEFRCR